jgi:phosphinothricin acetyltransferase
MGGHWQDGAGRTGAPTVRAAVEPDVPRLTEIYNHFVLHTAASFEVQPWTVDARRAWFRHYATTGPHRLLVADLDGRVAGFATSSVFRERAAYSRSVETTVYCDPTATGRGLGTVLYTRLFAVLADEDLHRAYAGIALPNDASEALHRRFGFRAVGTYTEVGHKLGRWWDVRWYERALG